MIDLQHIFHCGYECAVLLGRDNPLFSDVGFENVFFRTRPIVLSLALSTILSSTTFSSSSRNVQRSTPWAVRSKPRQSVLPLFRHRRFSGLPAWPAACGSARLQSPLPPAVCALGKASRGSSQGLR